MKVCTPVRLNISPLSLGIIQVRLNNDPDSQFSNG